MNSVAEIVEAAIKTEAELTYQADRLENVTPSTEDEAVYLEDLKKGYRNAAVYVNRMWTHQRKRLDRQAYDSGEKEQADPYLPSIDNEGRAIAHTEKKG
jgi:hypothetical protein